MIGAALHEIASDNQLMVSSGTAYGILAGCCVTLTEDAAYRRMSIYVGPQEPLLPGCTDTQTTSCTKQIIHMISSASGEGNQYALLTGNEQLPALILNHAGSVVTVNFMPGSDGLAGLHRFIEQLLPQIAPLTRPGLCILCGLPTEGCGCTVRLSADTVVPMHSNCYHSVYSQYKSPKEEHNALIRGIIGAAAGVLLGTALWLLGYLLTPFCAPLALLIPLLAAAGYRLCKGNESATQRLPIILSLTAIALLLGSLLAVIWPLHSDYGAIGSVAQGMMSEFSFIKASLRAAPSRWLDALWCLLLSAPFAALGCLLVRRNAASATAEASKPRKMKGKL